MGDFLSIIWHWRNGNNDAYHDIPFKIGESGSGHLSCFNFIGLAQRDLKKKTTNITYYAEGGCQLMTSGRGVKNFDFSMT